MHDLIETVLIWSEVWSLLVPLAIIIIFRISGPGMYAVALYVIIAFILNTLAIIISLYNASIPYPFNNNNILYNFHSLARVLLFSYYLMCLKIVRLSILIKIVMILYIPLVLINFIFGENPFFLSSRLLSAESIVLLAFCLYYFINTMQDESSVIWLKHTSFLICTGICIYESINFFIFLFYYVLENNPDFGLWTMKLYSISYILFCLLLALSLYRNRNKKRSAWERK